MTDRPSWDQFFLDLAVLWSTMSTCSRRQVGAVVVQGRKVIGNGFNGVASGQTHCVDGGCPRGQLAYTEVPAGADYNQFPCRSIHAEHNAILQAGLDQCAGATIYITDQPCQQCTNLIEHAKIGRIVILEHLSDRQD
ncbi:MAG TPA: deaminase [Candidatus Paceibacterota bacterium]